MADIPELISIIKEAHNRSHYGREGGVTVDRGRATDFLGYVIQASWNDPKHHFFQVFERDYIQAFITASMGPVYLVGDKLCASDHMWLARSGATSKAAIALMNNMIEWASENPECIEIKCGTTALIQDPERAGKFLKRKGFDPYGNIYRRKIK